MSSGSAARRWRLSNIRASGSPPGKSVRPHPSRNSVSPVSTLPSTRKHWLPGVWPGVCSSVTSSHPPPPCRPIRAPSARTPTGRSCASTHGTSARWTWIGHGARSSRSANALDEVTGEQGAADVVGVVVRGEHAGDVHAVGVDERQQSSRRRPGRPPGTRRWRGRRRGTRSSPSGRPAGRRRRSPDRRGAGGSRAGRCPPWRSPYAGAMAEPLALERLVAGQVVIVGGDRYVTVGDELADAFAAGDRLIALGDTGDLLHVPAAQHAIAAEATARARTAFEALGEVGDDQISSFFDGFAARLGDDDVIEHVLTANARRRRGGRAVGALDDPAGAHRRHAPRHGRRADRMAGLAAAARRPGRRRSNTTDGASTPAVPRSVSSGSSSRAGPTSSPTPPAWCAAATRW